LGSLAGHGFGGGLFPLAPLRGLQAWCSGRCGKPLGLFWPLCPGGPSSPQSLWALPEMGGQRGDRAGCGGKGGRGAVRRAQSAPLGPSPAPALPQRADERWRRLWCGGGRACSAGTRGMHRVPECACVRGAGPARRPSRPGRGQEGRGAGLSLGSPCLPRWAAGARAALRAGPGEGVPAGSVAASCAGGGKARATR